MPALVGLLPVLCFLGALVYLDSYKLVSLRAVVAIVALGLVVAGASYLLNVQLLGVLTIDFAAFTRYVSPVSEELLKGLVIVALIRAHRIGFLVDAAIAGFAVGTGFALVENLYYLSSRPDAAVGIWIVRGFGTAIMHGGATAIFAVTGLAMVERSAGKRQWPGIQFLPGFVIAVVIHSIFNHFFLSPFASTIGVAIALPLLLSVVFTRSEEALGQWLGKGFDADAEMLELIDSDAFSDSPLGRYLYELKDKFEGPVVADLLCYLRIYTELALRAKGVLMMREIGIEAVIDEATREKFAELRYLEKSIGKTGRLAIQPMLHMSHKELWQLYMIGV
jgi:protease PrsW